MGRVSNIGDQTVVTGLGTKLLGRDFDTKVIIDDLKKVREIPIQQLEDSIKINQKKIAAFYELKEKIEIFQEASNALRNIPQYDKSGNSFNGRKIRITTDASQPANNYIDIVANKGADLSNYEITVTNIAKAHSIRSQSFTSNSISITEGPGGTTPGLFSEGTFQINGVDVSISMGDSLVEIKAAINAVSKQSGVSASIIQVSSTDYRLVLQSNTTGTANTINLTDPESVLGNITLNTIQAAEDATFTINGVSITRSENVITDVLDNVTFTLKQTTDIGKKVYATITNDIDSAKSAIKNFVGAYNDLQLFASKQQELDEDFKYKETAILGNDSTLRTIISTVMTEMSSYVKGIVGSYITLGEIGLSFITYEGDDENPQTNNIIKIDDITLDTALATNFEGVRRVFEFDFQVNSKTIVNTGRTNALSITEFDIDIDTSRTDPDKVRITYNLGNGNITINANYSGSTTNGIITGPSGSVIEGLSMLYVGSGIDKATVRLSQGIADRVYNYLAAISDDDGDIENAIQAIDNINDRSEMEVKRKKDELDEYVTKMKEKFGRVEQVVSNFNSTTMFLQAQMNYSKD